MPVAEEVSERLTEQILLLCLHLHRFPLLDFVNESGVGEPCLAVAIHDGPVEVAHEKGIALGKVKK